MTSGAPAPPSGPTGDRLGVVIGSSLVRSPFPTAVSVRVRVPGRDGNSTTVAVEDHGGFVSLARHGVDGRTPAHLVDHHAHIRALVELGCERILAIGSSGSLRAEHPVGTLLAPDDLLALTTYDTFHDSTDGYALHGFDLGWRDEVLQAWPISSRPVVDGGTYAQVRGPRFETRAEIRLLADYADLVGMTLASECMLSSEAGLRYAAICQVDNLANGVGAEGDGGPASAVGAYLDNTRTLHETFAREVATVVGTLTRAEEHVTC